MKKRGRPSKLNPDLQANIIYQLELGNYIETAALLAGISKVTLYEWLKKGKKQKSGMYRNFMNAVLKAQALADSRDLHVIDRAAQGIKEITIKEVFMKSKDGGDPVLVEKRVEEKVTTDWKASAWKLERRHPEKFGRRSAVQITGPTLNKEQIDAIAKLKD